MILRGLARAVDSANANSYRLRMDEPALRTPEDGTWEERSAPPAGRRVPSRELLGERGELIIVHAGREYRLRLTHSGKLILTA
jgi:hemin uptake protein HemP